jgi:hypothetical protein
MALRKITTGRVDHYCKNGSDIHDKWVAWVKGGKKGDEVVCCEVDPDYQKGVSETCFLISDIDSTSTPSRETPPEPCRELPAVSGDITVNIASR